VSINWKGAGGVDSRKRKREVYKDLGWGNPGKSEVKKESQSERARPKGEEMGS